MKFTNSIRRFSLLYNEALKINPNNPSVINNLAKVYFDYDKLELAKDYCMKALYLNPNDGNIQKILSLIYFREHNFKDGWKYFDGRLNLSDFVEKNSSIMKIRNKLTSKNKLGIDSKILVLREQGVGDEIMFGSCFEDLLSRCDELIVSTSERILPLFERSFTDRATFVSRFAHLPGAI